MNNNSTSLPFTKVNLSLTSEAIDFLSETTNGTNHFAILGQLINPNRSLGFLCVVRQREIL